MTWEELQKTEDRLNPIHQEAKKQEYIDLCKSYHRCFKTHDGKRVLEDLIKRFIYDNNTNFSASNINYESAYHNGESGLVKFIVHQMTQAENI